MPNKIADIRRNLLHKLSTRILNHNKVMILEDLNVSEMSNNLELARAISQQCWYEFRALTEAKSIKFGSYFRLISPWEPTSKVGSVCKLKLGKIDLSVRSILCLNCGVKY